MNDQEINPLKLYERIVRLNYLIDVAEDKGWPCGTLKKEWRAIKKQLDKDKTP
jgi:hypothetical protein